MMVYKLFLFVSLCLLQLNVSAQNEHNGWYYKVSLGITQPSLGQENEGPLKDGYNMGAAVRALDFEKEFSKKLAVSFGVSGWNYKYKTTRIEEIIEEGGYFNIENDLKGGVTQIAFQTSSYYQVAGKKGSTISMGPILGIGYTHISPVRFLALRHKEGVFVGNGPFYDVFKLSYGSYSFLQGLQYHYGFGIKYKEKYRSNDGFFIDLQLLRFSSHKVVTLKNGSIKEGSVLLIAPTMGFVFALF